MENELKFFVLGATAALSISATAAWACPDWSGAPSFGTVSLSSGFLPDPATTDVSAGGPINLTNCSSLPGIGYLSEAPDLDLNWSGSGQLTIAFEANADTVLLINDPNGNWLYNDDYKGLNPAITIANAAPGLYDIWVGTVDEGAYPSGKLIITEMPY